MSYRGSIMMDKGAGGRANIFEPTWNANRNVNDGNCFMLHRLQTL